LHVSNCFDWCALFVRKVENILFENFSVDKVQSEEQDGYRTQYQHYETNYQSSAHSGKKKQSGSIRCKIVTHEKHLGSKPVAVQTDGPHCALGQRHILH
jgi:type VI protein secretion system component VasA